MANQFPVTPYKWTLPISLYMEAMATIDTTSNAAYRKISNIRRTKSLNLNVSRLGLQLSFRNVLKPKVGWRMKM